MDLARRLGWGFSAGSSVDCKFGSWVCMFVVTEKAPFSFANYTLLETQTSEQRHMVTGSAVARRLMHPSFDETIPKRSGDEDHIHAVAALTEGFASWEVCVGVCSDMQ